MVDLSVDLGGLKMRTPVATASGTFGYGSEYVGALDYAKLGAVTAKGVRLDPWPGNPMPRHVEVPGGLVNAIGLQGPGVAAFADYIVPHYAQTVGAVVGAANVPPLIVNIWGGTVEEYAEVARRLSGVGAPVAALEMNVSCPNVKAGGHTFGQDPAVLARVVAATRAATRLPLIVKLAPNVPDFRPYVAACEESGADALALINTIPAMVIDIETRRPVLGNRTGGLSGRGIHPAAVKAVYDVHACTKLPIPFTEHGVSFSHKQKGNKHMDNKTWFKNGCELVVFGIRNTKILLRPLTDILHAFLIPFYSTQRNG